MSYANIDFFSSLAQDVLVPLGDNFTPAQRTPWGGVLIWERYKRHLGLTNPGLVGESWELSAHPSFPNYFSIGERLVSMLELEERVPELLYGKPQRLPFLVKFLNSGSWQEKIKHWGLENVPYNNLLEHVGTKIMQQELLRCNLSVQVHPCKGAIPEKPSKTEAWVILDAEPGAGIYLGLREGVSRTDFAHAMYAGEDLSVFLNFVEVQPGEIYFIPSGTLHAIGAGLLLLEPQETSETTFRAYDWGRVTADGKPRALHQEETLAVTQWEGLRGQALVESLRLDSSSSLLVESPEFHLRHLLFKEKESWTSSTTETGIVGYTIVRGRLCVNTPKQSVTLCHGQSFLIPYSVSEYCLEALEASEVYCTYTPGTCQ